MASIDLRREGPPIATAAPAALATVLCAISFLLGMLVVGPGAVHAATPGGDARPIASRSDAELAALARRGAASAERIGEQLLADAAERQEIALQRDAARAQLGSFLAQAYRRGTGDAALAQAILTSSSIREATDRVRVARIVGDHHARLVRTLDGAEARLEVSRFERAQLVAQLTRTQATLLKVDIERGRRANVRSARAARQQARRAAAPRRPRSASSVLGFGPSAASSPVGTLVAGAPLAAGSAATPSAATIDAYLASKGSPMAGQGAAFVASGMRWRVDPRLLVAIAGAESAFGKKVCGPHNAWGWACPNDPADFRTWADGIDTVTRGLRSYYLDEGRTSVTLIQQKYCPVGAANDPTGLNSHWTANVTRFLVELGGNPASVGPGPGSGAAMIPQFGGISTTSS